MLKMDVVEEKQDLEIQKPINICRCCLADRCYKDISTEYFWLGQIEVYEAMLKDTFDICISYQGGAGPSSGSRLICEDCIIKLRDAANFKRQVLDSERDFNKHLESVHQALENSNILDELALKSEGIKNEKIESIVEAAIVNDDFDSSSIFDNDFVVDIKSEPMEDDDSDYDLATLKARSKMKRKASSKSRKSRVKKPKLSSEDKKKTVKAAAGGTTKGRKSWVPNETDGNLDAYSKECESEKKRLKENTLKLVQNSNICLFRHNRTKFKCFVCDDTFISMECLRSHMGKEHTDKEVLWKVKTLKMINLKKTDISDLRCKICDFPCPDMPILKVHLTNSHKIAFHDIPKEIMVPYRLSGSQMNNLTCEICQTNFKAFNKLAIHMNVHYQNNVCDICGVGFPNLSGLNQHKRNVHRNIGCKICGAVFTSSSKMQRHRIKEHKVVPRRKCPFCDATFRYSEQLYLHKIEAHGFERTEFKCDYCDKVFLIEYTLKSHVKAAHFRQKKHPCAKCDMSFYSNYELTRHLNTTHVTEKNVSCSLCNAKYKCISSLRRHLKSAVHRRSKKRHIEEIDSNCDKLVQMAKKQLERSNRKVKDDILKLLFNSNICLFRRTWTKYRCFCCEDTFTNMADLRQHSERHTNDQIAWKVRVLRLKSLQKIDISDMKCKICLHPCEDLSNLKCHLVEIHEVKFENVDRNVLVPYRLMGDEFDCVECSTQYKAINKLVIHMNDHYLNFVCDSCGQGFPTARSLKGHEKNNHKANVCKLCGEVFTNSSELLRHRVKVHKFVTKRHCMYCELTFTTQMALHMHKINDHGVERKEHKCGYCGKVFLLEYLMTAHVNATHLKQRKHACEKCHMVFYTKSELRRHLNVTHVDAKNFSCSLCNAKFKSKSSLRRHVNKTVHRKLPKM